MKPTYEKFVKLGKIYVGIPGQIIVPPTRKIAGDLIAQSPWLSLTTTAGLFGEIEKCLTRTEAIDVVVKILKATYTFTAFITELTQETDRNDPEPFVLSVQFECHGGCVKTTGVNTRRKRRRV